MVVGGTRSNRRGTAAAVKLHGGRVVEHIPFIKGVGGLLRFEDPAGNMVQAAQMLVVSSERRNISVMIRGTYSGRPGWSAIGQATPDG